MPGRIFVLAGVNGAGKSSIGGAALQARGVSYYNPDLAARTVLQSNPGMALEAANAQAWQLGRDGLQCALGEGLNFAFETTLGASTITDMLLAGARDGAQVHIWYAGLSNPDLHIQRVRERVAAGGHDIPGQKIRERFDSSRANLIKLLPCPASLRVYDNSVQGDPKKGVRPQPVLLLHMQEARIVSHVALSEVPEWAKPIMAVAFDRPAAPDALR
ncbi:ZTL protein [Pollutimonas bauzanensis]|uniref:Predicted ABC-type ATPase n=1 Tax=Pollutimonas bauzanensis TaxID=658167 RepID=A0A1M5PYZ5_9BURK|nr:ZTL protein [Pollutimonas bauzanensis]SHH06761.1 Predicted ABC-type ATPase [Pollutimonas bauzanensis]